MNLSKAYDLYSYARTNIENNGGENADFYNLFQVAGSNYFEYSRTSEFSNHHWLCETLGAICYHAENSHIVDLLSRTNLIQLGGKYSEIQNLLDSLEAWWGNTVPFEKLSYILSAYFFDSLAKTPTTLAQLAEKDLRVFQEEGVINDLQRSHYGVLWVSYALYLSGEYTRAESYLKSYFKNIAYITRIYVANKGLNEQFESLLAVQILSGSMFSYSLTSLNYTFAWNASGMTGANTRQEIDMYNQKLNFKWKGLSPFYEEYETKGINLVLDYLNSLDEELGDNSRLFVPYLSVGDQFILDAVYQKMT